MERGGRETRPGKGEKVIKQMDVLVLLRTKNKCLERFLDVSSEFLSKIENDQFTDLSSLQHRRDSILKAIDLFDRKLETALNQFKREDAKKFIPEMKAYVARRDGLLEKIKFIDIQLLRLIEFEKERIQKEISSELKVKKRISKFKSEWISTSGSEVDQKL